MERVMVVSELLPVAVNLGPQQWTLCAWILQAWALGSLLQLVAPVLWPSVPQSFRGSHARPCPFAVGWGS